MATGEVGKVGVAISSLEDMEVLLADSSAGGHFNIDDDQFDRGNYALALASRSQKSAAFR